MTTTRIINNTAAPIVAPDGTPIPGVSIIFTLVDSTGAATTAFDATTGERVVDKKIVYTDSLGIFTVSLWPNDRGDVATSYKCEVNLPNVPPFTAALASGATPISWLDFRYAGIIPSAAQISYIEYKANKDASGGYAGLTLFKLNLRNAANTITSWFTTATTVARTWTMPDKDGTVAMTSDISDSSAALSASSGASLVGYLPAGTGAVATTVQSKLRESPSRADYGSDADYNTAIAALVGRSDKVIRVFGGTSDRLLSAKLSDSISVFDFMTAAQIADVKANTAATSLASAIDVTVAIQAAINYTTTLSSVGGSVFFPPGSYKITSTIYTYGSGGVGQVGLVGSGLFSTRIFPSGDFTAFNLVTSYQESGGFSIEWPTTAAASIPTTRIGVEIAGANNQFSYATLSNVTVMYGYRAYVLNDWTGQPLGTAFLCTLQQLTAFRCADWGFYLNSKTGSTTLRLIHCYVRGDNSSGGAQYGKGIYANNFNDIYTEQLAVDQCLDSWVQFVNYNVCTMNGTAIESAKISSAAATAIYFNGANTIVNGIKDISCTYDTGGNARVIFLGTTCIFSLSGYNEQASTVAGGTTKYRVAYNAVGTDVNIVDRSVLPSHVLNNGWFTNASYQGRRISTTGGIPTQGTWLVGDYVKNGAPAVGQPKGWYCTVAGTPGTWVSEGNL